MTKPAYRGAWPVVRLAILERDGYRCQIKGKRCTQVATEVDHVVSLAEGGARLDPTNLRAACRSCNLTLGGAVGGRRRTRTTTPGGQPSRDW
jgi:5-methylcytosine-specific restriction endonuclease McrA